MIIITSIILIITIIIIYMTKYMKKNISSEDII